MLRNLHTERMPGDLEVDRLPLPDFAALPFARGDEILQAGDCADCFFLKQGLVSIRLGTDAVEVGLVGPGAVVNVGAILSNRPNSHFGVAVTAGQALRIRATSLRRLCGENADLQSWLFGHVQARMAQAMRLTVCHVKHSLEQRLASWIAAATRLTDADDLQVTHEQLAVMLGVHRPTITIALALLEAREAIRSRRGLITVRSRAILQRLACDCRNETVAGPRVRRPAIWPETMTPRGV